MKPIKYQRTKRRNPSKLLGHPRSKREILICDDIVHCNDHIGWKEHITLEQIESVLSRLYDARYELMRRLQKIDNNYYVHVSIDGVALISDALWNMRQWTGKCLVCACLDLLDQARFVVLAILKMEKMQDWYQLALRALGSWGEDIEKLDKIMDDFVEKSKLDN
jgi:hypothetical protein